MKKYKLSKSDADWLAKEAKKLPPDFSATMEKKEISGEAVALSGYAGKTINGEAIDKKAVYVHKVPNIIPVNHKRRLFRAYEEGGWEAVNLYLDKYRTPECKLFPEAPKPEPVEAKPKTFLGKIRKFINR